MAQLTRGVLDLNQTQLDALTSNEQQGFGSHAIFGEQHNFYIQDPQSIWSEEPSDNEIVVFTGVGSNLKNYAGGTSAVKGEVVQYITADTEWKERANLTSHTNITTLGDIIAASSLPASPSNNDIVVVDAIVTVDNFTVGGTINYSANTGATAQTGSTAVGDIAQYDNGGNTWRKRGDLTDLTGISTIGDVNASTVLSGGEVEITNLYPTIFEFVSSSIVNESTQIIPERISPTASPLRNQDGMVTCGGDFNMHLHVAGMLLFWKYILMDPEPRIENPVPSANTPLNTAVTTLSTATVTDDIVMDVAGLKPANANTASDSIVPCQLTFTLVGTPAAGGTIAIKGTDQNDSELQEILEVPATAAAVVTTKNYFKSVDTNGAIYKDLNAATSARPSVKKGQQNKITFRLTEGSHQRLPATNLTATATALHDGWTTPAKLPHGLTAEIVKGDTPNVYTGLLVNSATLTFAENIDIALSFIGYRGFLRQNIKGEKGADATPTIHEYEADGHFETLNENTFKGWGCAVRVYNNGDEPNENIIPVTDVTLTVNHSLENPPRYWGQRFPRKPTRTAKREIMLDCTTDYTDEDDYGQYFFENRIYDNAELLILYAAHGEAAYQTLIKLGRAQFTTYTDPEVSEQGPLLQALNIKSLPRTSTSSDELIVEVTGPETLKNIVKNIDELNKEPNSRTANTTTTEIGAGFADAYRA